MFSSANALTTCTQHGGYSAVDFSYHQAFPLTSPQARCNYYLSTQTQSSLLESYANAYKQGLFVVSRRHLWTIILLLNVLIYYNFIHHYPACISTRRNFFRFYSQLQQLVCRMFCKISTNSTTQT